jgi:hypothetical protein
VSDINSLASRVQQLKDAVDFWNWWMVATLVIAAVAAGLIVLTTQRVIVKSGQLAQAQGSLFVIGSTSTSIVVAADSRQSDRGKVLGARDKLIQLGNFGVCFVGRYSEIGEPPYKADFQEIITDWIRLNPKVVAVPNAYESMSEKLLDSMKASRRRDPKWKPEYNDPFSYFICVGYWGLPKIYASQYVLAPRGDVTSTSKSFDLANRSLVTRGLGKVCQEITNGNTPAQFSVLKSDPAVVKYRKALKDRSFASISQDDLLRVSRVCLEATESPEGRAFDPDAKFVGPPNRYCVIDERQGFKWVDPPH